MPGTTSTPDFTLATIKDLNALVTIENRCFEIDRMSSRSIKHMIQKANCDFILGWKNNVIVGYALVLYHQGTHLARLYSFAVLPEVRGQGVGEQLLQQAEEYATSRDCIYMRLEVHPNNSGAIRLYKKLGYHPFGMYHDYYEDHADALRFEKRILFCEDQRDLLPVPYYQQTTDFTCGSACLIMAMQALGTEAKADRILEIQLWREATTIYMTSGHGGSSPLGLALAAWRRGFRVEVYINTEEPLFLDGVRNEEKKAVMQLVHEEFVAQIKATDIRINYNKITLSELEEKMDAGGIPLVMISSYSYTRDKAPHWVVMSGIDETFVYIHDPHEDEDTYRSQTDNIHLPVARQTFDNSFRFGKTALRTSVIIYNR
ncbi:MAG: GNAT family N-acetyltransferase/peptidase C39 family protein [Gammaproteobacteria bacterium]|nr:GNAT family N-acetyltransferase/peptidase C39 family protein [Gammaproteobacteria bacterium]